MILTKRPINEADKALAQAILDRDTCRHGPNADCSEHHYNNLVSDIVTALATVRQEVATAMRSACVRELRERLRDPSLRFADDEIKAAVTDWTNMLITKLEAVTLDQQQEKQSNEL